MLDAVDHWKKTPLRPTDIPYEDAVRSLKGDNPLVEARMQSASRWTVRLLCLFWSIFLLISCAYSSSSLGLITPPSSATRAYSAARMTTRRATLFWIRTVLRPACHWIACKLSPDALSIHCR